MCIIFLYYFLPYLQKNVIEYFIFASKRGIICLSLLYGGVFVRYDELRARLRNAGIENDAGEAALLLSAFEGVRASEIPLCRDRDFTSEKLTSALLRREKREPLQYILGEWDFYNESYTVSEDCLVPRSDTELLVEVALKNLPQGACFADLCTGSGCVAVSTLANRKDTKALAVELYPRTLELACRNAEKNGVSDRFLPLMADVLLPLPIKERFDAILSNPPYIRTDEIETLAPEVRHEPRAALDGGRDGMIFYRAIVKNCASLLREGGFFAFEIGADEGDAISEIASENGFSCELFRDLGGNDRVAVLKKHIN